MHRIPTTLFLLAAVTTAQAADLEPGLYEVVTKTTDEAPSTARECVTAADIAKGLAMGDLDKSCKVSRSTLANGRIDFAATCKDATMTMSGTYTATTFAIASHLQGNAGGQAFKVDTSVTAKKVGNACKPE